MSSPVVPTPESTDPGISVKCPATRRATSSREGPPGGTTKVHFADVVGTLVCRCGATVRAYSSQSPGAPAASPDPPVKPCMKDVEGWIPSGPCHTQAAPMPRR